jgi:hypothetical protein
MKNPRVAIRGGGEGGGGGLGRACASSSRMSFIADDLIYDALTSAWSGFLERVKGSRGAEPLRSSPRSAYQFLTVCLI